MTKWLQPKGRRWLIWTLFLAGWTALLVFPISSHTGPLAEIPAGSRFWIAKSMHVVGYALLTVLCFWLRTPRPWPFLLLFFVMAHGTATELIQLYVAGRSGQLHDVAFDHAGVLLGLLLSWRWWSQL